MDIDALTEADDTDDHAGAYGGAYGV